MAYCYVTPSAGNFMGFLYLTERERIGLSRERESCLPNMKGFDMHDVTTTHRQVIHSGGGIVSIRLTIFE